VSSALAAACCVTFRAAPAATAVTSAAASSPCPTSRGARAQLPGGVRASPRVQTLTRCRRIAMQGWPKVQEAYRHSNYQEYLREAAATRVLSTACEAASRNQRPGGSMRPSRRRVSRGSIDRPVTRRRWKPECRVVLDVMAETFREWDLGLRAAWAVWAAVSPWPGPRGRRADRARRPAARRRRARRPDRGRSFSRKWKAGRSGDGAGRSSPVIPGGRGRLPAVARERRAARSLSLAGSDGSSCGRPRPDRPDGLGPIPERGDSQRRTRRS